MAGDSLRQINRILGIDVLLSCILLHFGILCDPVPQKDLFKQPNKEQHGFWRRK